MVRGLLVTLADRGRVQPASKAIWYDPDRELPTDEALDPHRPSVREVMGCAKDLGQFLGLLIKQRSLRGGGR
jgi:hypothetical protein